MNYYDLLDRSLNELLRLLRKYFFIITSKLSNKYEKYDKMK